MKSNRSIYISLISLALVSSFFYISQSIRDVSYLEFQTAAVSDFNSSLIAYYSFDEGSGTAASNSRGSYSGTLYNDPLWIAGKIAGALSFDGIDDYVSFGDMGEAEGISLFTISAWVKSSIADSSSSQVIIAKSRSGQANRSWSLYRGSDEKYAFEVGNGSSIVTASANTSTADTEWHHVVGVYDGSQVMIYVDAVSVDQTPPSLSGNISDSQYYVCLARTSGTSGSCASTSSFSGSIDDVRIYNKALSTQEIADLYALGGGVVGQAPPPPVTPPSSPTDPVTPPVTPPTTPPVQEVSVRSTAPSPVSWTPPIGIPEPPFGIRESHYMYQLGTNETCTTTPHKCYDFGSGLEPYRDAGAGPYTHYVDVSNVTATDSSNPYGTYSKPRKTIPVDVPAGSVVEVHGGPYTQGTYNGNTLIGFNGQGTISRPVFLRGPSDINRPVYKRSMLVTGTYVIVENLSSYLGGVDITQRYYNRNIDSIGIRNMEFRGSGEMNAGGGVHVGIWNTDHPNTVKNVVIYNNEMSYLGKWDTDIENDASGILVDGADVSNVWVVDNSIHHNGGDSIRVGNNAQNLNPSEWTHHVYIARNKLHSNRENALDIKNMRDIVVIDNDMYGALRANGSYTDAVIVAHYSPHDIWIANNRIHDALNGVVLTTDTSRAYVLDNVIYNLRHASSDISYNPKSVYGNGVGVHTRSSDEVYIVGNVFYEIDRAMTSAANSDQIYLKNNIISSINDGGYALVYESASRGLTEISNNIFYQQNGSIKIISAGSVLSDNLTFPSPIIHTNNRIINPLLNNPVSDFRISAQSPAIDAGASVTVYSLFHSQYGVNLARSLSGNSFDIGAYEYGSTGGIQSPPTIPTPAVVTSPQDTTGPSLSNIAVSSVTTTSLRITWNTNEGSISRIEYGPTTAYGNTTTRTSTYTTTHTIDISNLTPNTVYHYRVMSTDAQGNITTSGDGIVSTSALLPQASPTVPQPVSSVAPVINTPPPSVPGISRTSPTSSPSVSPRSTPRVTAPSNPYVVQQQKPLKKTTIYQPRTNTSSPDLVIPEDTEPLPTFIVPTLWEQFIAYIHHIYTSIHDLLIHTWTRIWGGVVGERGR